MATKKQENQINNVWNKIQTLGMSEDDVAYMNIRAFLYSVDRLNVLQVTAEMTAICLKYGMTVNEVIDLLK